MNNYVFDAYKKQNLSSFLLKSSKFFYGKTLMTPCLGDVNFRFVSIVFVNNLCRVAWFTYSTDRVNFAKYRLFHLLNCFNIKSFIFIVRRKLCLTFRKREKLGGILHSRIKLFNTLNNY